jgi:hypothetical protein
LVVDFSDDHVEVLTIWGNPQVRYQKFPREDWTGLFMNMLTELNPYHYGKLSLLTTNEIKREFMTKEEHKEESDKIQQYKNIDKINNELNSPKTIKTPLDFEAIRTVPLI